MCEQIIPKIQAQLSPADYGPECERSNDCIQYKCKYDRAALIVPHMYLLEMRLNFNYTSNIDNTIK